MSDDRRKRINFLDIKPRGKMPPPTKIIEHKKQKSWYDEALDDEAGIIGDDAIDGTEYKSIKEQLGDTEDNEKDK